MIWGGDVKGQRVYGQYVVTTPANSGGSPGAGGAGGLLGGAGNQGTFLVTNPGNASDGDLTNFATLSATSGSGGNLGGNVGQLSTAFINLNFTGSVTPAAQNAIIFKLTGGDLTKIFVQAYNGTTPVGTAQAVSGLSKTGSGDYIFTPTAACNSIGIIINTAVSGLLGVTSINNANIYYAYFMDPTCSLSSYTTTSMTGINVSSTFLTPDNAIDGNITTYSRLSTGLGVATTLNQDIYLSKLTGAQDAATITFSIPPSVLAAGVAAYINIITYNGTTNVGQIAFSGLLLGTDLLNLVKSGLPTTLSYAPGVPFNRIQISSSSLVGLATSLDIYEVTTTPAKPTFTSTTTQNVTICAGNPATLNAIPASSVNELRWYSAIMGGALLHTGNSYTPIPTPTADTTTYFVATGKIGCTIESERVPAKIIVRPLPVVAAITGTLSTCMGSTTQLGNPTTGGAWSSLNTAIATISSTGLVSGVAPGTATINYVVNGTNGCPTTVLATITINALPVVNAITGTLSACIGNTTQLSSSTSAGVWTSGTPAVATINSSGLVTGVTTGTSLITYTVTNGNGCVASQTATVTINALPVVSAITGTLTACIGNTTQLSSTTSGGVWSSGTPAVATVSSSGLVTGVTSGTAVITYTVTNANGCTASQMTTVTINPLPVVAAITGTLSACIGNTTQLSCSTSGGVWTSATPAVATVNSSGLLTGVTAGTSVITYTVTNANGCIAKQTATVTINALPVVAAITGTLSACIGNTTQLSSTTSAGVWTSGTPAVASINSSGLVTGLTSGTSLITYTVTNGNGCVATQTTTVTINALPVVAPITGTMSTCIGKTTQLANTTSSGVWSSVNPTIATVNSAGLVTGVAVGTATINYTVTNSNGCITIVTTSVAVHLQPALPAISQKNLCLGQSIDLNTLNPSDGNGTTGGNYSWSAIGAGGTPLSATLVSPALGNTTYYLRYTKDGCFSDSSVLIIMHPKPPTPHVTLN
ncbi:hypothetical protein AQ505_19130 [Pedobacter sp. PACM 27299]|nr:hypothetical protein AQ505_19130 [Pedobacter sp. PACM 27299]